LAIVDDFTRECLALVADASLPGLRVARELDAVIAICGRPAMIVSDNGAELNSMAMLRWSQERQVEWHYIVFSSAYFSNFADKLSAIIIIDMGHGCLFANQSRRPLGFFDTLKNPVRALEIPPNSVSHALSNSISAPQNSLYFDHAASTEMRLLRSKLCSVSQTSL
jgi:hypothetical protein